MTTSFEAPTPALVGAMDQWHKFIRGEAPGALDDLLDDDAVMFSPVVHTPQRGKEIVKLYLSAAGATFGGDKTSTGSEGTGEAGDPAESKPGGFGYTKQLASGNTAMLEFETTMKGKHVNGVDIITVNDEGRIVEFRVMIRPLQAVHAVHEMMGAMLERLKS